MDSISAVGFASSILTFIDFSWKLVKGSYDVYQSTSGATSDQKRISAVVNDLRNVTDGLRQKTCDPSQALSPHWQELGRLSFECSRASEELHNILENLRRKEGNKAWRSLEAKWASLRKEKEVATIEQRLNTFRLQLLLRLNLILNESQVSVSDQIDKINNTGLALYGKNLQMLTNVRKAIESLESKLMGEVSGFIRHNGSLDQASSFAEIHGGLSKVTQALHSIPQKTSTEVRILKRLCFGSIHSRIDNISDVEFGTFEWILEDVDPRDFGPESKYEEGFELDFEAEARQSTRRLFHDWIESGNGVFHISGKPGSGKSTLMKFLCQDHRLKDGLAKWAGNRRLVFASFFFWGQGDDRQKSLEGLYRSLLFEILRGCPELIQRAFPGLWAQPGAAGSYSDHVPFRLPELKQAMRILVEVQHQSPDHRFCFFIDGLDEFEGDSTDHWELAEMLRRWGLSPDVKVCVSSRPHIEFLHVFDRGLRMHLHDLTRPDIRQFIEGMLAKEPAYATYNGTLHDITQDINDRADGVFLWVRLVVRSLLDGLRHRYSAVALRGKIEKIPRGLKPLFIQLFNSIDPDDRRQSDRMLLLVAEYGEVNALMLSWLEDLDDPDFPFNAPIRAYSDDEVGLRHETVRSQLDSLSKGLLEMTDQNGSANSHRPTETFDGYFGTRVGFFHRTVQDFLKEPGMSKMMRERNGSDFDVTDAYQRLRLAEFKFARTTEAYMNASSQSLMNSFKAIFLKSPQKISPRILDEYSSVLDHHAHTPFTYPLETTENSGIDRWSLGYTWNGPTIAPFNTGVSYVHFLAWSGQSTYVTSQVATDKSLLETRDGLSLLLTACLSPDVELVRDLMRAGASPNQKIKIYKSQLGSLAKSSSTGTKQHVTTVWAIFVFFMAHSFIWPRALVASESKIAGYFYVLEELLRGEPELGIRWLLEAPRRSSSGDNKHPDHASNDGASDGPHDNIESVYIGLEDLVLLARPYNMDALMKQILKRKRWGSVFQGPVQAMATTLSSWIGFEGSRGASKELGISREDIKAERYVVRSVRVGDDELVGGFKTRLY